METHNKIVVKQALLLFPEIGAGLKRGSKNFDESITEFSGLTGLPEIFLKQNIDLIRNWI